MFKRAAKWLAAVAFISFAASTFGQGVAYSNVALAPVTSTNNAQVRFVSFANIRVCTEPATGATCAPPATLYQDSALTVPLQNPFQADMYGNYLFYVSPGTYHIQVTGPQISQYDLPYQALGNGQGTVSSIATASPISGGPITTNGTISCPTCLTASTLPSAFSSPPPIGNVAPNTVDATESTTSVSPVYNVKSPIYGAKGGAKMATTGSTSNTSTTLTCSTCNFSPADITSPAKVIEVQQGGGANIALMTTIAAYISPTQITMGTAASYGASNQVVFWGYSQDELAYEAAMNASLASGAGGVVYFPADSYMLGTNGNFPFTGASQSPLELKGDCSAVGARVIAIGSSVPTPACTTIFDGTAGITPIQCSWCINVKIHGFLFIGFPNTTSSTNHSFIDTSGRNDGGAEALDVEVYDNGFWGNFNGMSGKYVQEHMRIHDNSFGCETNAAIFWDESHSIGTNNSRFDSNYVDMNNASCPQTAVAGIYIKEQAYTATITNVVVNGSNQVTLTYTAPPPFIVSDNITQSGLSSATFLNGQTISVTAVVGNTITANFTHVTYSSADSGTSTLQTSYSSNIWIEYNEIQNMNSGTASGVLIGACISCAIQKNDFESFALPGLQYGINVGGNTQRTTYGLTISTNTYQNPQNGILLNNCTNCKVDSQYYSQNLSTTMNGLTYSSVSVSEVHEANYYSCCGGSALVDGGGNSGNVLYDTAGNTIFNNNVTISNLYGALAGGTQLKYNSSYLSLSQPQTSDLYLQFEHSDNAYYVNFNFRQYTDANWPNGMLIYGYDGSAFHNWIGLHNDTPYSVDILAPLMNAALITTTGGYEVNGGSVINSSGKLVNGAACNSGSPGSTTFCNGLGAWATPVSTLTTYTHGGTANAPSHIVQDTCTLGTSCGVTLAGSAVFTSSSSYSCVAQDATATNATAIAYSSGSAFTITGTGTDVIRYICTGY